MGAIIFDFDGTLANSSVSIRESVAYAFDKLGLSHVEYCQVSITQQDLATSFRATAKRYDIKVSDTLLNEFIKHYRWYHREEAERKIQLFDGVEDVLEALRAKYKLGIATTKPSDEAKRVIKALKIDHYFDHIQGTDKGLRYKPAPDIILRSLQVLEVPAEKAVYVGDAVHDMEAAKSAGVKGVAAAYGFAGDEGLKKNEPHFMIYNISDLNSIHSQLF